MNSHSTTLVPLSSERFILWKKDHSIKRITANARKMTKSATAATDADTEEDMAGDSTVHAKREKLARRTKEVEIYTKKKLRKNPFKAITSPCTSHKAL